MVRHDVETASGFTLVELLIATVILLVVLAVGAAAAGQASSVWRTVYHDTHAVHDARRGLARVAAEVRLAAAYVITVDTSGADADVLIYQVPVGRTGASILWGAETVEGRQVRMAVEQGRLLRRVLDADGDPQGRPQVLATDVDGLFEGAKAFSVTVNGQLVTIRLRTCARTGGHAWRKTVTTTVAVRN